jgi:hypothetical protein
MNNAAKMIGSASLAGLLAFSASAAEPAAQPTAPTVAPAESTVLPNAPKVGDTAPGAGASTDGKTAAEVKGNPDWPCVQRKVLTLTSAQIWDGPPVDDLKGWEDDAKIRELTAYLESRRVPLEDAEKAIKEYAGSLPQAERDQKLTQLFASVLAKINTDRKFVMDRVEEYQRRQQARAMELEREGQKLAALSLEIPADEQLGPRDTKLTPEQQEYDWNSRIFQERQENLTMACEIPILIEQRAYEVGKLIRAQMSS